MYCLGAENIEIRVFLTKLAQAVGQEALSKMLQWAAADHLHRILVLCVIALCVSCGFIVLAGFGGIGCCLSKVFLGPLTLNSRLLYV